MDKRRVTSTTLECKNEGFLGSVGNDGPLICICNAFDLETAYAGLECEYKASAYCVFGKSFSSVSFCVNGGVCRRFIESDQDGHEGCKCPQQFEGRHCEYRYGEVPEWDSNSFHGQKLGQLNNSTNFKGTQTNVVTSIPTATIAMIVIMLIGACAAMVAVVGFVLHINYSYVYKRVEGREITLVSSSNRSHGVDNDVEESKLKASIQAGIERARREEDQQEELFSITDQNFT